MASGLLGEMAMTSTPRCVWAVMKGICEVASAVAGAAVVNSQPSFAQPSTKPWTSESK
jgi:hypothetical protein